MKTVRLLSTYMGFRPQTIITVDDATGTALLAGGVNATTDLTGGTVYVRPSGAGAALSCADSEES